ncbi:STAS domain-containing protein [Streptomyces sp. SP18CS02]|uniref:STAS domain-containing protein n=1 Tax=Streptomyces sp. SP18CS02 TaxID=3002531 RepID=UPI002E79F2E3|nr:STAS domain-containing protein [Streptomyces sp. SP18CS02]MEE1757016.1 STAS domain-containing protein [Streptomyces sp. SP18CS02]
MLNIITTHTATGPVLHIGGDLDFHTASQFRRTLESTALRAGERLVLDLGGLVFCDSSGITAFLVARNHAAAAGAEVTLAAVPENTARILRIVGLDQVFSLQPGPASAGTPAGPESTAPTGPESGTGAMP